jgi:homoserine O-acetyltransferase
MLVLHALTGDSRGRIRRPGTSVSPDGGLASSAEWKSIDTDRWFVVAPNMLGGCQGSWGLPPLLRMGASGAPFSPHHLTIRDQVSAQVAFLRRHRNRALGGGREESWRMQASDGPSAHPDQLDRVAVIAAPTISSATRSRSIRLRIRSHQHGSRFAGSGYYSTDGDGPLPRGWRWLAAWPCSTTAHTGLSDRSNAVGNSA